MKTRTLLLTIVVPLFVLLSAWTMTIALSGRAAAGFEPQATTEPSPRYGHTMVTISNTVYLFGGETTTVSSTHMPQLSELLNDLWSYNAESDEWQIIEANPPPKRKNHSAAVYNDRVYIFFGEGASGKLNDIWEYDPATHTWTQMPSNGAYKPTPCSHSTVVSLVDGIYFFGGVGSQDYPVNPYVYAYDPSTGYWTRKAPHPEGPRYGHTAVNVNVDAFFWRDSLPSKEGPRYGHTAVNVNNRMVVYGGVDVDGRFLNDMWQYDPTTDQWTQINPSGGTPPARAFHTSVTDGTRIWIAGGDSGCTDLADTWEYDILANVWTRRTDLPAPRSDHAAALLPSQGSGHTLAASVRILIFGGQRDGQVLAEALIYTPSPQVQIYLGAVALIYHPLSQLAVAVKRVHRQGVAPVRCTSRRGFDVVVVLALEFCREQIE